VCRQGTVWQMVLNETKPCTGRRYGTQEALLWLNLWQPKAKRLKGGTATSKAHLYLS
jgi:hypothetical protein